MFISKVTDLECAAFSTLQFFLHLLSAKLAFLALAVQWDTHISLLFSAVQSLMPVALPNASNSEFDTYAWDI